MILSNEGNENPGAAFPTVYWPQWKCRASFYPALALPDVPPSTLFAVLGFVYHGELTVLAQIKDRGYCIPSGKIEEGEEPLAAMIREAYEEIGAILDPSGVRPIGWFILTPLDTAQSQRVCPVFVAEANEFVEIPVGSESLGMRLTTSEDIPTLYFFWDNLMAAVFNYAEKMRDEILLNN